MKNILPRADFARVKIKGDQIDSVSFEKDDESKVTSYKSICEADSGSGNWVTFDDDSSFDSNLIEKRSVLVATISKGTNNDFEVNGKVVAGVCGANMILENGKLWTAGTVAVKTTNPVILGFIKKYAKITKYKPK